MQRTNSGHERSAETGAAHAGPLTDAERGNAEAALLAFADVCESPTVTLFECQAWALERRLRWAEAELSRLTREAEGAGNG